MMNKSKLLKSNTRINIKQLRNIKELTNIQLLFNTKEQTNTKLLFNTKEQTYIKMMPMLINPKTKLCIKMFLMLPKLLLDYQSNPNIQLLKKQYFELIIK